MKYLTYFLLLAVTSHAQDCDINDPACDKAVQFSQKAKEQCKKEYTDICRNEPRQLHKRFLARFVASDDKDKLCGRKKDECQPNFVINNRKKREIFHHIEKRQGDDTLDPLFKWTQHQPKGNCCVTTRREIPLRRSCGNHCFIVFCPLAGGYQWSDEIRCNVNRESDLNSLKVKLFTKGDCDGECQTVFRTKSFLVTNIAPKGWFGHCFEWWAPVWIRSMTVPSYCQCK